MGFAIWFCLAGRPLSSCSSSICCSGNLLLFVAKSILKMLLFFLSVPEIEVFKRAHTEMDFLTLPEYISNENMVVSDFTFSRMIN